MLFEWSSVGTAPEPEQIEVTVFGPGFGESICVHLGHGEWAIVDSCVDTTNDDDTPVPLRYLRALGVQVERQVKLVAATHWHADHVRGMGRLFAATKHAKFVCAQALLSREFFTFVERMNIGAMSTGGAKVQEFRAVLDELERRNSVVRYASGNRRLYRQVLAFGSPLEFVDVWSLSPSDREYSMFLDELPSWYPQHGQPQRAASARTPNKTSVVLAIQWRHDAILLGADMEATNDVGRGWTAAIVEGMTLERTASLVKVPHHGAYSGHHEGMWNDLLEPQPVAVVTPFNRGKPENRLPKRTDVDRIVARCSISAITATRAGIRTMRKDPAVERGLRESGITVQNLRQPLGMVRARKTAHAAWLIEKFPPATDLANF